MSKCKTVRVFDGNDLSEESYNYLCDLFGVNNGSCYYWNVAISSNKDFERITSELIELGAELDEIVLIQFSW